MQDTKDPNLAPIIARLSGGVPDSLDLESRCRLIQHFNNSISRRPRIEKDGIPGQLDYTEAEANTLAALVSTLRYSTPFVNFLTRCAEILGQRLAADHPLGRTAKAWKKWTEDQRLDFLKALGAKQCTLISHDQLRFTTPPISASPMGKGVRGGYSSHRRTIRKALDDTSIRIDQTYMQEGRAIDVCTTLWHEHIHVLCHQFAAAMDCGRVAPHNPFHQDAETALQRYRYGAYPSYEIIESYQADPEENLAFKTQAAFSQSWAHHSSPLTRLRNMFG